MRPVIYMFLMFCPTIQLATPATIGKYVYFYRNGTKMVSKPGPSLTVDGAFISKIVFQQDFNSPYVCTMQ